MMWKDIKRAPKVIGIPLWVRGWDFGVVGSSEHFTWAYWNGTEWRGQGCEGSVLLYLTQYLDGGKR